MPNVCHTLCHVCHAMCLVLFTGCFTVCAICYAMCHPMCQLLSAVYRVPGTMFHVPHSLLCVMCCVLHAMCHVPSCAMCCVPHAGHSATPLPRAAHQVPCAACCATSQVYSLLPTVLCHVLCLIHPVPCTLCHHLGASRSPGEVTQGHHGTGLPMSLPHGCHQRGFQGWGCCCYPGCWQRGASLSSFGQPLARAPGQLC